MEFFKRLFGLPDKKQDSPFSEFPHQFGSKRDQEHEQDIHRFYDSSSVESPRRGFDVFTDPLQMHQYFEQQMNEMLRSFGFQGFENMFGNFNFPSNDEGNDGIFNHETYSTPSADNPQNLRDHFLKKGYEKPSHPADRKDKDIDGSLHFGDIDSVLKGKSQDAVVPYNDEHQGLRTFSFGQSMTSKTVMNPDGSVETHKSVRDNTGNEETTITRKFGDKEYKIIKKRDKDGKEEIIENFINMDEKDKDKFMQPYKTPKLDNKPHPNFPFDKFFK